MMAQLRKSRFSKPQLIVFALAFALIGLILVRTFAANPNLPGDINNDNTVNITDLSILLTNYGTTNATADLNADNIVNITDLSILLSHYNQSYTPPVSGVATLPAAPKQGYTVPATATAVNTIAGLKTALSGANNDIVLEDGTYSDTAALAVRNKHLYARHVGAAIINTGVDLGSNGSPGGQVYGLKIKITSAGQQAPNTGAISVWGAASGAIIQDTEIDGSNVASYGVAAYQPNQISVERVVVRNTLDNGLRLSDNQITSANVIKRIWDVYVDTARNAPIAAGTGEAGIWIGHQVADGVQRIEVHRAGWMGVWTGNAAKNFTMSDVTIADIGPREAVGIYAEHDTVGVTFQRLNIDTASTAYNSEWWYDGHGSHDNIIQDFVIKSGTPAPYAGIFLDAGSYGYTIRRGTITTTNGGDGVGYPVAPSLCGPANTLDTTTITYSGTGIKTRSHTRGTSC